VLAAVCRACVVSDGSTHVLHGLVHQTHK